MFFFEKKNRKNLKYLDLARRGSSRFLGGVKKLGARSKVTLKAVKSIASFGRKRNNVTGASKDGNSASVQTAPAQPSPLPDINDEMLQVSWWPFALCVRPRGHALVLCIVMRHQSLNMCVRVCVYLLRRGLATAKINPINCLQELSSTCFIPFLLIYIHAFWGFFLAFLSFILLFLAYFYIDGTSEIRCRGISSASSFFTFFPSTNSFAFPPPAPTQLYCHCFYLVGVRKVALASKAEWTKPWGGAVY